PPSRTLGMGLLALSTFLFGLLEFMEPFTGIDVTGESFFIPAMGTLRGMPLARMSPMTGLIFFISGLSLFSLLSETEADGQRERDASGLLGALVFILGLSSVLGYIMGLPLLYDHGALVPVALNTSFGFLFLGLAETFTAGTSSIPLRFFLGDSTKARLMRTFVPLTTGAVLVTSIIMFRVSVFLQVNPVLLTTVTALIVMVLTGLLASAAALGLGRVLDRAEKARKASETALRESEERFRALFEQASVGVARIETQTGRFLQANKKYCDIVGKSVSDMKYVTFMEITHPEDLAADLEYMEKLKQGVISEFSMEKRYIRPDGAEVWVNLSVSPLWAPGEAPTHHIAVVEDITDRKKLETQLLASQKLEAVGTLAGGVAHDFNNVLSIIMGNADLGLCDPSTGAQTAEFLEEIRKAALRAKDVVRQLMTFTRMGSGNKKAVRISPVVSEALRFVRASIPHSISIEEEFTEGKDVILASPTQIQQVVINLCANAAHAIGRADGRIRVETRKVFITNEEAEKRGLPGPGRYIALIVEDNGQGIEQDVMDRIFDPYFTTKEQGKGTGLGLFVVQGIVRNHQGAISVESEPGKGSVFTVLFAVSNLEPEQQEKRETPPGRGMERVLCVDDEPALLSVLSRMLEKLGYQVTAVGQSPAALDLFRQRPGDFDVVITDMTMPSMTGDVLLGKIKEVRREIPVILCTGYMDTIKEEVARQMGAARLVRKPVELSGLASLLREVLSESQGEAGKDTP
ncbi:MAG: PAS domain S-box protein, partial [Thermodesulfobacteriota bacterium]